MIPELDKLRRFSLLAALLLFSYSVAGIQIKPGATIPLLGIPFTVSSPELLPMGLVVLSVYGLVRFYYYGVMLSSTPYRTRRDLIRTLQAQGGRGTHHGRVLFGPTEFLTTPLVDDRADVEAQVSQLIAAFPKLGRRIPEGKIEAHRIVGEDGEPYTVWGADISIPVACRLAAIFQDIDYTAPIWANVVALAIITTRALA